METVLKIPERKADVSNLREIKSVISQRSTLLKAFAQKKQRMEQKLQAHMHSLHKELAAKLQLHERSRDFSQGKRHPAKFLCTNNKDYLGNYFIYISKVLTTLKEDPALFKLLVDSLDAGSIGLKEEEMISLAEEVVYLFLTDFVLLRHVDYLLSGHLARIETPVFDLPNFVNRMLEAFIRKPEIARYTKLLFSDTLLRILESTHRSRSSPSNVNEINELVFDSDHVEEAKSLTHFLLTDFKYEVHQSAEAIHSSNAETTIQGMPVKEVMDILDGVLGALEKHLVYMPLELRFLCKAVEERGRELHLEEARGLVADFLLYRWWGVYLTRPEHSGLVELCVVDERFSKKVLVVLRILKEVFRLPKSSHSFHLSPEIAEYIEIKAKAADSYLTELLDIIPPNLDETQPAAISVESICASYKLIEAVFNALDAQHEVVAKQDETVGKCLGTLDSVKERLSKGQPMNLNCKFDGEAIDSIEGLRIEASEGKECYFVFQKIEFRKKDLESLSPEKWQRVFFKLLLDIDLSSSECETAELSEDSSSNNEIMKTMQEITKRPGSFATSEESIEKVRLMGYFMCEFFKELGADSVLDAIVLFNSKLTEAINTLTSEIKMTDDEFDEIMRTVGRQERVTREFNRNRGSETITLLIASHVIEKLSIPFQIDIESDSKNNKIFRYSITFFEKKKGGNLKTSSYHSQKAPAKGGKMKKGSVNQGYSIKDFVDSFHKFEEVDLVVVNNGDAHGIADLYSDFMHYLRMLLSNELKELPEPPEIRETILLVKDPKQLLLHIEDYVMSQLYPLLYPKDQTAADIDFFTKMDKFQTSKVAESLVSDFASNDLLTLGVEKFRESSSLVTPRQKLKNYEEVHRMISDGLEVWKATQKSDIPFGNCQIFIFVVLYSKLPRLISDKNYIENFKSVLLLDASYKEYFKDLIFAIDFLSKLSPVNP